MALNIFHLEMFCSKHNHCVNVKCCHIFFSDDENVLGNERTENGEAEIQYQRTKDKLELLFYPEEDTEEWIFFQKVLTTVQTWFSLFGWPSGCNPITIPDSLWR